LFLNRNRKNFKKVLPAMLEGNTFSVNMCLLLGLLGFFIAGIDISTELAKEKDEINFVLDNLEDACNIPQLSPKGLGEISLNVIASLPVTSTYDEGTRLLTSVDDRGPPELA